MTTPEEEEPVAYLGGQAAPPATKPSDSQGPASEPIVGYLGGESDLPALPPVSDYQASDFISGEVGGQDSAPDVAELAANAADEGQYTADGANLGATVLEPGGGPNFEDGSETMPEGGVRGYETATEFPEPDLPKTITQQDAENIIKRITTKKILPPEVAEKEGPRVVPTQELTPRSQPGLKVLPIVLALVFVGYIGALLFRDSILPLISDPTTREWVAWALLTTPPVDDTKKGNVVKAEKSEYDKRKEEFEAKVQLSERMALGIEANVEPPTTPGGTGTGNEKPTGTGHDDKKTPNTPR